MVHFVRSDVLGGKFETPNRYSAPETLKIGVSGIVCSSWDQIGQQYVAVKKIIQPFNTPATAQHIYREIKLLRHLKHENVIRPLDIFISPREDIYLVTELMQTDLRELLDSKSLSHEFVQFFLYQLMRGLKYIHSAGVVHRDLEPKNILINENCDLKICDFGLARVREPQMTGYLSTISSRLYRAPEIMLLCQTYGEKVDIWSAGCIFAEMLLGKPLFPGKDSFEQFSAITKLLGTPSEETLVKMTSQSTRGVLDTLPQHDGLGLSSTFPNIDPSALQLLEKMLVFDPDHRISAAEALTSPYLASYHDPTDEPVAEEQFDWTLNGSFCSDDVWKQKLYAEVLEYHKKAEINESVKKWTQTSSTVQK
ncbi:uncharacterized protein N7515_003606 [Penicillium bovifimosum]|uniref:mitogen-activated protein kinase n=1 Tax=Penicillium bovifimosum TaxID=126998 RepID=A0A9W9H5E8_9EURO|nr:uncharacterized protein N7515_003606 [Penicillium bovifimosum]KAJ5138758.1 hypothetical protein N7515_003606 [Penicillium bovifimosum]